MEHGAKVLLLRYDRNGVFPWMYGLAIYWNV